MKILMLAVIVVLAFISPFSAMAVTEDEDIASTIMLRGYACGGRQLSNVVEQNDAKGNETIEATCPNGHRYRIVVSNDGRVTVTLIH